MALSENWGSLFPDSMTSIPSATLDELLNDRMLFSAVETVKEPTIEFIEQPKARGYRFRYASEGASHGPLLGERSTKKEKRYPSVHIRDYRGPARILVSLVTADDPAEIHAHNLTGDNAEKGYVLYDVSEETNMAVSFTKLAIEHVIGQKIVSTLMDKLEQEEHINKLRCPQPVDDLDHVIKSLPQGSGIDDSQLFKMTLEEDRRKYREKAKILKDKMNLGAVRLRIDAFLPEGDRFTKCLPTIYSQIIYDQKSHGELKIVKLSKTSGSVNGNEEIILLCEKVTKENIEIRFFEEAGSWSDFGSFTPGDVHKQYAIVFQTPPYRDRSIARPVVVSVELRRKNNSGDYSKPVSFTYEPQKHDKYKIGEKRKKETPAAVDEILEQESAKRPPVGMFSMPSTSSGNSTINVELFRALGMDNLLQGSDMQLDASSSTVAADPFGGLFFPPSGPT